MIPSTTQSINPAYTWPHSSMALFVKRVAVVMLNCLLIDPQVSDSLAR
jgi:hypothetical protein